MEDSYVSTSQLANIWKTQEGRFQELELKIQGKVKQDWKLIYRRWIIEYSILVCVKISSICSDGTYLILIGQNICENLELVHGSKAKSNESFLQLIADQNLK